MLVAKKLSFYLVGYNKSVIFAMSFRDKAFIQFLFYEVFFIVSRTGCGGMPHHSQDWRPRHLAQPNYKKGLPRAKTSWQGSSCENPEDRKKGSSRLVGLYRESRPALVSGRRLAGNISQRLVDAFTYLNKNRHADESSCLCGKGTR